jgi:hypothetical protein
LESVPVPLVTLQVIPAWLVALDPAVIFTAPEVEQVDTAVPATAEGAWFIVSVLVDVAFEAHGAFGVEVKVNITLPALISATLGVYVAVVNEPALAKVPVPFDVHVVAAAFKALEPAVIFTAPEFEQVFTAVPATAVGCNVIVCAADANTSLPGPQLPALFPNQQSPSLTTSNVK